MSLRADALIAVMRRIPPWSCLGFAFVLAWEYYVFFSPLAFLDVAMDIGYLELLRVLYLAATALALLLALVLHRHLTQPLASRALRATSVSLMCLGTILLVVSSALPTHFVTLLCVGGALCGMGNAGFLLVWGDCYQMLAKNTTAIVVALTALVALGLHLLTLLLDGAGGPYILFGYLLAASLCGRRSARANRDPTPSEREAAGEGEVRIPWRGALATGGFWAIFGIVWTLWVSSSTGFTTANSVVVCVGAITVVLLIVAFPVVRAKQRNISLVFWWAIPLTILGLSLNMLPDAWWSVASFSCIFSAVTIAGIHIWVHFSSLAQRRRMSSVRVFGFGWLVIVTGELVGSIAGISVSEWLRETYLLVVLLFSANVVVFIFAFLMIRSMAQHRQKTERDLLAQVAWTASGPTLEEKGRRSLGEYGLTDRELEIVTLILKGRNVPYIVNELVIAKSTVNTHIRNVYEKLGIHSRQDLIDRVDAYGRPSSSAPPHLKPRPVVAEPDAGAGSGSREPDGDDARCTSGFTL